MLDKQYWNKGIDFDTFSYLTGDTSNPESPVLSGIPTFTGRITGHFVYADGSPRVVNAVEMTVGQIDVEGSVKISLLDSAGATLSVRAIAGTGFVRLDEESSAIGGFIVHQVGEPGGFAIDNLSFYDGSLDDYVALGDSYSSGEGTEPFDPETFAGVSRGCHRATDAWARLSSDDLAGVEITGFLACSGALAADITTSRHSGEPPQAKALAALPSPPDVVTITIGGNDAGFSDALKKCVIWTSSVCSLRLARVEKFARQELAGVVAPVYAAVQEAAGQQARVIVVGYPNIMNRLSFENAEDNCFWLEEESWEAFEEAQDVFNKQLRSAATRQGFEFVDTYEALAGHELCTDDSWLYPLDFFSGGNLRGHPTLEGQQALAGVVAGHLD